MELISIGFLAGVLFSLIVFGAGVIYADRFNKRESNTNSDVRIYIPSRDRNRSGNHRRIKQVDAEGYEIIGE